MSYTYPRNLFVWQPVFDWLTRLDARAEAHGWDLWIATTKSTISTTTEWLFFCANTLGAAMAPSSDAEARICNDILAELERLQWIKPIAWKPRRGGAPKPKKGYKVTLFARGVDCTWEPGDECEALQEFVRKQVG